MVAAGCSLGGDDESSSNEGDGGNGGAAATGDDNLSVNTAEWATDFTKHSVPLSEFIPGGPPKDGIPSIDDPKFISQAEGDEFLDDGEPVAVLEVGGEARAYPIQILTWHEIVNDEIGGEPIALTFCPLCNSTVAFSRVLDGETVEFGTTGNLRRSDLVMYDRKTETWWQQLTAEAIVGELTGQTLEVVPSQILSWGEFKSQHPDSEVLSRDTGFDRSYGTNPYAGYDSSSRPFLYRGSMPKGIAPMAYVVAVETAFRDPQSYFTRFSNLDDDEATATATDIWKRINERNLVENIRPTRDRADLILRKGPDRSVVEVRLSRL